MPNAYVGHGAPVAEMRRSGARLITRDDNGHWVLWDLDAYKALASGDLQVVIDPSDYPAVELAGNLVVVPDGNMLTLRSAADGAVVTTLATSGYARNYGIPPDGSYVWQGTTTKLQVWSNTGAVLVDRAGNYGSARMAAAPGELRVALGPAGANTIEYIATDTAASTSAAFTGTFTAWFHDGERFLTTASSVARVYSKAAVQEQFIALPTAQGLAAGEGNYFWTMSGSDVTLYTVGTSSALMTYPGLVTGNPVVMVSDRRINFIYSQTTAQYLDLRGGTPSVASYPEQIRSFGRIDNPYTPAFAVTTDGDWAVANQGIVFDSAHAAVDHVTPLNCGLVTSISGSRGGRAALATASGQILHFVPSGGAPGPIGVVPVRSNNVQLTSDGNTLATSLTTADEIRLFTLPSGDLSRTFALAATTASSLDDYTLSAAGARIGTEGGGAGTVTTLADGTTYFDSSLANFPSGIDHIYISPDENLVGVSGSRATNVGTEIYMGNTLIGAANGYLVGWIDSSRLIVQTYGMSGGGGIRYVQTNIVDTEGNIVANDIPADEVQYDDHFIAIDSDRLYLPERNNILTISTGNKTSVAPTFTRRTRTLGAVAGQYIVYVNGNFVYAQQY
jgi:hypothetical protein